jgi:hypothetical protein
MYLFAVVFSYFGLVVFLDIKYISIVLRLFYASLTLLRFLVKSARMSNILLYDWGGIAHDVNSKI